MDILPALSMSAIMGILVNIIGTIDLAAWQTLLIQISAGELIYFSLSKLFKLESLDYIKTTVGEIIRSRKIKKESRSNDEF